MLVQVVSGLYFQEFEFGPLLWSLCMWVITGQYIAARILPHLREFCTLITLDSGSCGLRLVAHWLFLISLITFPFCRQGERCTQRGFIGLQEEMGHLAQKVRAQPQPL